jgi:hypothetical protein
LSSIFVILYNIDTFDPAGCGRGDVGKFPLLYPRSTVTVLLL